MLVSTLLRLTTLAIVISITSCSKLSNSPLSVASVGTVKYSTISHFPTDRRPYIHLTSRRTNKMIWLVDSGATHSFLMSDGSKFPEIQTNNFSTRKLQTQGFFTSQQTSSNSFKFIGKNFPPISGYTLPVTAVSKKIQFDGILGLESLRKHRAVLYFKNKQLSWETNPPEGSPLQLQRHSKSGHLMLTMQINGTPINLLVDTGATRSILAAHVARKLDLKLRSSTSYLTGAYASLNATHETQNLRLFISDSSQTYRCKFLVSKLSLSKLKGLEDIDGLIGYDFLHRNFSAISFGNSQLHL